LAAGAPPGRDGVADGAARAGVRHRDRRLVDGRAVAGMEAEGGFPVRPGGGLCTTS